MMSHFKTVPREYLVRGAVNPKITFIKVVGFVGTSDDDLQFDLELDLQDYLKVRANFLNRNRYF